MMHMFYIRRVGSPDVLGEGVIFSDWSATVKWLEGGIVPNPETYSYYTELQQFIDGLDGPYDYEMIPGKEVLDSKIAALILFHDEERDAMYERQQFALSAAIRATHDTEDAKETA